MEHYRMAYGGGKLLQLRAEGRIKKRRDKMRQLLGLLAEFKNPSKAFICGIKRHIRAMN